MVWVPKNTAACLTELTSITAYGGHLSWGCRATWGGTEASWFQLSLQEGTERGEGDDFSDVFGRCTRKWEEMGYCFQLCAIIFHFRLAATYKVRKQILKALFYNKISNEENIKKKKETIELKCLCWHLNENYESLIIFCHILWFSKCSFQTKCFFSIKASFLIEKPENFCPSGIFILIQWVISNLKEPLWEIEN